MTLGNAIDLLYTTFSGYTSWNADPAYCGELGLENIKLLQIKNVRELTHEDLDEYIMEVLVLFGNADEFKHFLPRIFELSTLLPREGAAVCWSSEFAFNKLTLGHWRTWPTVEQIAIEEFLTTWFSHALAHYPAEVGISPLIGALAESFNELMPFLDKWHSNHSRAAYEHFVDFERLYEILNMKWLTSYQKDELRKWLSSQKTFDWLHLGYQQYSTEPLAQLLGYTIQRVHKRILEGSSQYC